MRVGAERRGDAGERVPGPVEALMSPPARPGAVVGATEHRRDGGALRLADAGACARRVETPRRPPAAKPTRNRPEREGRLIDQREGVLDEVGAGVYGTILAREGSPRAVPCPGGGVVS